MTGRTSSGGLPGSSRSGTRARIPSWRLATGILIHFAVPAYLLACVVAWVSATRRPGTVEGVAELMIATLAPFLVGYAALMLAAGVLAQVSDMVGERRHPGPPSAEAESARLTEAALTRLHLLANASGSARLQAVVHRLSDGGWDYSHAEGQKLGRDLADATDAFARAYDAASMDRRPEVEALAADGLERLADAHEASVERTRTHVIDAARTATTYLTSRYGSSSTLDLP